MKRSDISGFHKLTSGERLDTVAGFSGLTEDEKKTLSSVGRLDMETAGRMIENVIGTAELPLGIATNFTINGKDYLVPMALEEPSVVAGASYAAKLARPGGGFKTSADQPIMIGQIQLVRMKDPEAAIKKIISAKKQLLEKCMQVDPTLVKFGGGPRDIEARVVSGLAGKMVIVHILVDVRDAMGANAVNTMAETISGELEALSGGKARAKIISNLAIHRLARAEAVWKKEEIGGEDAVDAIMEVYAMAAADEFRCATHNKGVMNGIDAVVIATGNDFRAVEAGMHAYAAMGGRYKPITSYSKDKNGNLVGKIELPMAVGIIGGSIRTNPIAKVALKILCVTSARELAQVIAAVGLAQNFAAIRAIAMEGIQRGHMGLHARNIAVLAGATGEMVEKVAKIMCEDKKINVDSAKQILCDINGKKTAHRS